MRRALALSERGAGWVAPNPLAGAVLVKDDKIIGEGWHARYGQEHAEAAALRAARGARHDPSGATLYITLEPCNHQGQTPPCTEAIMAAGIKRVVYAMADPNPRVAGGGGARLQAAGLRVIAGVEEAAARAQNKIYCHWITAGTPYVLVKAAVSADDKISKTAGRSTPISGSEALRLVQALRQRYDAVLVGAGTVLSDDPRLTVRFPPEGVVPRNPWRVVLDGKLQIPLKAKVLADPHCLIITADAAPAAKRLALSSPAEIITLPASAGRFRLADVLTQLAVRQITSVMVEGGAEVFTQCLEESIGQEWLLIRSRKKFGAGLNFVRDPAMFADRLQLITAEPCGADILEYYRFP